MPAQVQHGVSQFEFTSLLLQGSVMRILPCNENTCYWCWFLVKNAQVFKK